VDLAVFGIGTRHTVELFTLQQHGEDADDTHAYLW
jgi:hypothetical protein